MHVNSRDRLALGVGAMDRATEDSHSLGFQVCGPLAHLILCYLDVARDPRDLDC